MSWFQSTNLASFAKTALKEAQKTIDKALEIGEAEEDGTNRGNNSTAAVSNVVTEKAAEFLASWGVGGGLVPSPSTNSIPSSTVDATTSSSSSSSNAANSPFYNSAISSPPKRTSLVEHFVNNSDEINSKRNELNISDVPVTLLASSTFNSSPDDELDSSRTNKSQSPVPVLDQTSGGNKHSRSLSDTVFHAPDDSTNNLGDLVQVLDDNSSSVALEANYNDLYLNSSYTTTSPGDLRSSSTFQGKGENEDNLLISLSESNNLSKPADESAAPMIKSEAEASVGLLLEIDLDGEHGKVEDSISNVITTSTPRVNVVESTLSDGWDWTSATDSCLIIAEEEERHRAEEESASTEQINYSESKNDALPPSNVASMLESSPNTTSVQKTVEGEEEEEEKRGGATEEVESIAQDQEPTVSPPPPIPSPPPYKHFSSPSTSRPSSPVCPEQAEERGSTPPSSARVSPNFEIVTSSGGPQPESSRSSSIVVVSGRDSTQNSRGTSGAGSSGSSEGGHDIGDHEIPHSPAAATSSPVTGEFCKVSKHKKGASSSSSDIEVIPSDYSSSSPSALPMPCISLSTAQKNIDFGVQTQSLELKDCEVQTEIEEEAPVKNSSLDSNELSKLVSAEVADILAEKEQEAQQLREEGEKLSVKQFELSQVIKKLRAKEKETESVMKGLRADMATKNLELEKLMKTFVSKEGIEQSQNDTILKLNQERRKLELRVEQLNSDLEDAKDNVDSMKATVENASIEILELKNVISSVQRESAEVDRLTRDKAELTSRSESLQKEVEHLRSVLNSSQNGHHSREAELKSQISLLTQKIHELEYQLADISSDVADATMPLSMEIEKLQGELKQQLAQADRREHSMQSTIADLELKLTATSEREKSAKDLQIQYQSQHSTLELRIEELEARNRSLTEQLLQKEEIHGKKLDDKQARCQKLEKTVERLTGEVERLASENDSLSNELKAEKTSLEAERRRNQSLVLDSSGARENNNFHHGQSSNQRQPLPNHQRSSSISTTASSTGSSQTATLRGTVRNDNSPRSREHSPSEHSITSEEASYLDEVFDPTTGMMIGGGNLNNRSMTPKSFFESFSSASLIENLQAQLRHREGEVLAFQEDLNKNEKIRKQLNEEIANLTMQNQQLGIDMERMGEMQQKLDELDKNYNAVLQMYGEKVEEADELRMDLDDVKEMYKTQIEQLLKKS